MLSRKFLSSVSQILSSKPNGCGINVRSFFFKKQVVPESDFVILRTNQHERDEISDLLWESYYPDEALYDAMQVGYVKNKIFDDLVISTLCQGHSFIARCKYNNCITGVCLNRITNCWDPEAMEKYACCIKQEQITKLFLFLAYVQRAPELWTTFCTDKILEVDVLCVGRDYRQRGLATELLRESLKSGADAGFRVIRFNASSLISQALGKKVRMEMFYDIPYCSYITPTGEPIIEPRKPNDQSLQIFITTPKKMPKKKSWFSK